MAKDIVVPANAQFAYDNFHFAQAARANGFLLCSGQIGTGVAAAVAV